jgi:hypothetical protein
MKVRAERECIGSPWRVLEADGSPCLRWLPDEPSDGPLDAGGFDCGVNWERAFHGLLDLAVIERERRRLDAYFRPEDQSEPEPMDWTALVRAVQHPEPVIEFVRHRESHTTSARIDDHRATTLP